MFPLNQWYVAGFAWELKEQPLARVLLDQPIVMFSTPDGGVAALEDGGIRCGYHGLKFSPGGQCIEVPGQVKIPGKARVRAYPAQIRNEVIWIWFGADADRQPDCPPPRIAAHENPAYVWKGGAFHYQAPYQLIHDNLLDLSHVGYLHGRTIGGNARVHMEAPTIVTQDGDKVRVVRWMKNSLPPATYTAAWPFKGNIDRWQDIDFHLTYLQIFTGAVEPGSAQLDDPERGGFHMRGFHGITPETATSTHYFWTMASSSHPDQPDNAETVYRQTEQTFEEDRVLIETQYRNMLRYGAGPMVDIHVDAGANRARRVVAAHVAAQAE